VGIDLIRKNNQTNVTAYHDAVLFHSSIGLNGVLQTTDNPFSLNWNSSNMQLTVGVGMGTLYGRQFEIRLGEEVIIDLSALVSDKKLSLYVEIDTRDPANETIALKMSYADGAYPAVATGDDLISARQGIARLQLYRLDYKKNNNQLTYFIDYKLLTYGRALRVDNSTYADLKTPLYYGEETFTYNYEKTFNIGKSIANGDVVEIGYELGNSYGLSGSTREIKRFIVVKNGFTISAYQGYFFFNIFIEFPTGTTTMKIKPTAYLLDDFGLYTTQDYIPFKLSPIKAGWTEGMIQSNFLIDVQWEGGVVPSDNHRPDAPAANVLVGPRENEGFRLMNNIAMKEPFTLLRLDKITRVEGL
jgi:hypothetical protein